jgi:hypothetical protein
LAPECLHGRLGQSEREPMTGSSFRHLAIVQNQTSGMKLDSHRKNNCQLHFPSVIHDVRIPLFSLIVHIPHHTLRNRRQQWPPLGFIQTDRSQHPSISHFWRRTLLDRSIREKLTLEGATSSALNTLVNMVLPDRMAFCLCNSCNELQNL